MWRRNYIYYNNMIEFSLKINIKNNIYGANIIFDRLYNLIHFIKDNFFILDLK